MTEPLRRAWVEVDLDVIRKNASILAHTFAPAELCAVVKADGYGHGAVPVAQAAVEGGATWLAVALVEEGIELREAGLKCPILVLSEPAAPAMQQVVAHGLTPALYTDEGIAAAAAASRERPLVVHVKVDTGMNRVGASPVEALALLRRLAGEPALQCEGLFTHFAVADEPDDSFTKQQADLFDAVVEEASAVGVLPPKIHLCNSAGGLLHPKYRRSLVRSGIALYGIPPSDDVALPAGVRPAMRVRASVSLVKTVDAGSAISYGQRYRVNERSVVATVPVGYADGWPRALSAAGGEVLIGGRRRRLAGTVTMDQFMVDCGDDKSVTRGHEVVLLGGQGQEDITANEIGHLVGSIGYEVVCRLGPRLPRVFLGSQ